MDDRINTFLKRVSTVDALVKAIITDVLDGQWLPGEQIKEVELVERYGVSRHSIRESLVSIVEQGILEKRAHKGVFIPIFSEQDIKDIYFSRLIFEKEAVRKLVNRKFVPKELFEVVESFKNQKETDPWSNIVNGDVKFHKTLVDSLNCKRVSYMFNNLMTEFKLINRKPQEKHSLEEIYQNHSSLLESILEGKVEKAISIIEEHLQESAAVQIEEHREFNKIVSLSQTIKRKKI